MIQQTSVRELAISAYRSRVAEEEAHRDLEQREATGMMVDELRRFVNGVLNQDFSRLPLEMIPAPGGDLVPSVLVEDGVRLIALSENYGRRWVIHLVSECGTCEARSFSAVHTLDGLGLLLDPDKGAHPPCICGDWQRMAPGVAEHTVDGHIRGATGFCEFCGSPWPCPTAAKDIVAKGGEL